MKRRAMWAPVLAGLIVALGVSQAQLAESDAEAAAGVARVQALFSGARVGAWNRPSQGGAVSLKDVSDPPEASSPEVLCFERAVKELQTTAFGAVSLCSGTKAAGAPLDCFKEARRRLNDRGAILLCSGTSESAAPSQCFDQAIQKGASALGAATLCHAAPTAEGPLACAEEAGLRVNWAGVVQLCGGVPYELHKLIYYPSSNGSSSALGSIQATEKSK